MFHFDKKRRKKRSENVRTKGVALQGRSRPAPFESPAFRLLIVVVVGIIATLIIGIGGPPFPYRLGERSDRVISFKVPLTIVNDTKWRNEQDAAAERSPLYFQNDPAPNIELQDRLVNLATVVAEQPVLAELDKSLRDEWKLNETAFINLRSLLPADPAGLKPFTKNLRAALAPIVETGVLDVSQLPSEGKQLPDTVAVINKETDETIILPRKNVTLSSVVAADGMLDQSLRAHFPEGAGTLLQLIAPHVKTTLTYFEERTAREATFARARVPQVTDIYRVGMTAVPQNTAMTLEQLQLLRAEHEHWLETWSVGRTLLYFTGLALIVGITFVGFGLYLKSFEPAVIRRTSKICSFAALGLVTLFLARVMSIEPYSAGIVPVALASFALAIAYNRPLALTFAFSLSLLYALMHADALHQFLVVIGGTAVGILLLDAVRSRNKLVIVGLYAGLAYSGLSLALGLMDHQSLSLVLGDAARGFASGLGAGVLLGSSLPFIESLFGIVTDISLIELSDTSHTLLQELVRRAPGTYNHSVTVSIISEAAAKAIGCNALQVRVGALFHDIGKMLKPHYFIENKSAGESNRHDQLEPAMSTLIIIGHVKDGADLARQHHLPQPIIDMIEQHHGNTLVDYFYREASKALTESEAPEERIEEAAFRYPGPRPQGKEAAVLMLADCVESASRTLSEPTPARIEKLVHSLSLNRLLDGQFSETGITLEEVKTIENSLTKSLASVYHGRIKYPSAG